MSAPRPRGLLVVLEGIDGAGKSTLQRALARALRARGVRVALAREPADARLGREGQRLGAADPFLSALYFTLDRARARPAVERILSRGTVLIQDRSFYSTLAYQGARLSPRERGSLERLQRAVAREPDRVLWLDLAPREALERVGRRAQPRAPFERRRLLERVRREYRRLARRPRWVRLDARQPPGELVERALAAILRRPDRPRRRGRSSSTPSRSER